MAWAGPIGRVIDTRRPADVARFMWIFLDIDGVLVPEKRFERPVPLTDFMQFDPGCLRAFESVLDLYPNIKVVISSSWREVFPFEKIPPLFSPKIAPRVVGATPFLDPKVIHQTKYVRYEEVLAYLRQQSAEGTPWVAIDDIPEHFPPGAPVVVTDAYQGFDVTAAARLTDYLAAWAI